MGKRHPGIRIDETPSSPRPIEGVGTSVAAFVGLADGGPSGSSYVHSWAQYTQDRPDGSALAAAVEEYFRNGGSGAWVATADGSGR